jgi:hypothetical protein
VIAEPPSLAGAVHDTVTRPWPTLVARTDVGAPGVVAGIPPGVGVGVGVTALGLDNDVERTTHRDFLAFAFDSNLS